MREIVTVQVGQCGNQIGTKFWEDIQNDHDLDPSTGQFIGTSDHKLEAIGVYFNETSGNRFTPRSVLVDSEPEIINRSRDSSFGQLLPPSNLISGFGGFENCYARGFYSDEGKALCEQAMESIRREVESADSVQGFQVMHSLGGGTGSGLGGSLLQNFIDTYPAKSVQTNTVLPSGRESEVEVEAYNACLGMKQLIECTDLVVLYDNEALSGICTNLQQIGQPTYADLNRLVATNMAEVTASMRFNGPSSTDLRQMAVNLVPWPRSQYCISATVPMSSHGKEQPQTVSQITPSLCDTNMLTCSVESQDELRLQLSVCTFRGSALSSKEIETELLAMVTRSPKQFHCFTLDKMKIQLCDVPSKHAHPDGASASILSNTTSHSYNFKRILDRFTSLYKRKAHIEEYLDQGMDALEFQEAETNLSDCILELSSIQGIKNQEEE